MSLTKLPTKIAKENSNSAGGVSYSSFVVSSSNTSYIIQSTQDDEPSIQASKNLITGDKCAFLKVTGTTEGGTLNAQVRAKDGTRNIELNTTDAKFTYGAVVTNAEVKLIPVPICINNVDYAILLPASSTVMIASGASKGTIVTLASVWTPPAPA